MKHFAKILTLGAALVAAPLAHATPITGGFSLTSFAGSYITGTGATVANSTAALATGLDFGAAGGGSGNGYGTNGTAFVGNANGSFSGLTMASVSDISLDALANPYTANPFISFTGSNLAVNFSNASYTRSPLGTSITISGVATLTDGIAADITPGTFSLSTSSQNGSAGNFAFTFTSNVAATAAPTPEPSSLVMLGTGLMSAAGMLVRRRRIS